MVIPATVENAPDCYNKQKETERGKRGIENEASASMIPTVVSSQDTGPSNVSLLSHSKIKIRSDLTFTSFPGHCHQILIFVFFLIFPFLFSKLVWLKTCVKSKKSQI